MREDRIALSSNVKGGLDYQALAKDLTGITGIMSCTVIDLEGEVLGRALGDIPHSEKILNSVGALGAVMWAGLKIGENEGGPLRSAVIDYATFRVVGIPVNSANVAILFTASLFTDVNELMHAVIEQTEAMMDHLKPGQMA